jgi:hypothetical protein
MVAITALVRESSQAAFPIVGDAAEARYLIERLEQQGWTVAEAASPPLPEGLDVERLAEAGANVLDGRRIGSVRLYRNTITSDDWQAIAAEYVRLTAQAKP